MSGVFGYSNNIREPLVLILTTRQCHDFICPIQCRLIITLSKEMVTAAVGKTCLTDTVRNVNIADRPI